MPLMELMIDTDWGEKTVQFAAYLRYFINWLEHRSIYLVVGPWNIGWMIFTSTFKTRFNTLRTVFYRINFSLLIDAMIYKPLWNWSIRSVVVAAAATIVVPTGNRHSQSTMKSFFTRWIIYGVIIHKQKLQLLVVHWERLWIGSRLQMMELHKFLFCFSFIRVGVFTTLVFFIHIAIDSTSSSDFGSRKFMVDCWNLKVFLVTLGRKQVFDCNLLAIRIKHCWINRSQELSIMWIFRQV